MDNTWKKLGLVLKKSRAQLPTVSKISGELCLVYSNRDEEGRSFGQLQKFRIDRDRFSFSSNAERIIYPGAPGSMDVAGAMPMQIIGEYLYYIGWTRREDVPYFNYTCAAKFANGTVKKLGPILSPCIADNGYSGTFNVVWCAEKSCYLGFYLSGVGWEADENGELQPQYDIKIAKSNDLINWKKTGLTAVNLLSGESGLSSATVIKVGQHWHMWFSSREATFFRGGVGSYKILHAFSSDGLNWHRSGLFSINADLSMGENMAAYPNIFAQNETLYIFYNGKDFGVGGVSAAKLDMRDLSLDQ